jgi:hypothetical protein
MQNRQRLKASAGDSAFPKRFSERKKLGEEFGSFLGQLPKVKPIPPRAFNFRNSLNKKPSEVFPRASKWVQGLDLNQRPSGYEGNLIAVDPT